jgi:glycosyltransferase involved in cell wall biosynthesis
MQGMSNQPLRILCLDIEGGYGGSSRSLYESVRHLDRKDVSVEVWCKRAGPIQAKYASIGVPCCVVPGLPKVSSLPTLSRNLYVYGKTGYEFLRSAPVLRELAWTINDRFDLVHFNHEAFFLLARWLRRRTHVPFTMHIRTNLLDTMFARWQVSTIARTVNHLVFITENERTTFERLGGRREGAVIYNIVMPPQEPVVPHGAIPCDGRFKIACISNYMWVRGTDRLMDVAAALAARRRRDFLFVVAGESKLSRSLPGLLGRIGGRRGTLTDYAVERGVADMFLFLGHVPEPESVLAACDVLAKPTREDNPWGRDILEAMAAARPVLTVGTWDKFVQDGHTGVLQPEFDAEKFADAILDLADHREKARAMGRAAQEHVLSLCDGPRRAAELLELWRKQACA